MQGSAHDFWDACVGCGVVSKRLALRTTPSAASPVGLVAGEAIPHGAPLISVPYNAVFNGQTLRGDTLPRALPPLRKMVAFLTRRNRMGTVTAHTLWLSCFLACYRQQCTVVKAPERRLLQPLLSGTVYPPLPSFFSASTHAACPSLRGCSAEELQEMDSRVQGELNLTYTMMRHYMKHRGVSPALRPSREMLVCAHRSVMQRAVLLPWNGAPSAPEELSELVARSPELPLLPSLVPVIDLIRATPSDSDAMTEAEVADSHGNCAVYTCVQSDFLSSASRRRVVVETAPLAARRVVVCATKPLKEGEELLMDYE